MTLASTLSELLPTKWSRVVALATWPFAIAASTLPHFLSPALPSVTQAEVVLSQIVVFLIASLVGSLTTLVLVLRHCRATAPDEDRARYSRLAEHHRVIFAISRTPRPSVAKIARATRLSEEAVVHYIQFMRGHKYIKEGEPLALTDDGHRAVLQL